MAGRTPQREDQIDKYYDDRFNHRAQSLRDQEQATGRDSYANSGVDQAEAFANDPKNASKNIDDTNEKEQNPNSNWANKYTGGNDTKNQSFIGKLKGQKKKGPLALLVLLFGGGGILFTTFFSPALLLVHVKNMFLNDLSDVSPAQSMRSNSLLRNKIKGLSATAGICTNKITVRCKFSTFSDREVRKFERAGFTVEREKSRMPGRNVIKSISFEARPGQTTTIRNPQDMRNFARTPEGRSALNRAFRPKTAAFIDRSFNSTLLKKFGINKASKLSGNDKSKIQESFDKSTGADKAAPPEEGGRFKGAVEESGRLTRMIKGGALAGLMLICPAYDTSRKIIYGVKVAKLAAFAAFAMTFLSETDKMIAGKGDPEVMSVLGDQMTSVDTRKQIENDDGKKVANPNYGKSPTDAEGYRLAAYGDVSNINNSESSSAFSLGPVGILAAVGKFVSMPGELPGGKTALKVFCKVGSNLATAAVSIAAACGVGGIFTGGVAFAICALGNAAVGAAVSVLTGIGLDKFTDLVIKHYSDMMLDSKTIGPDVGNAMFAGSSAIMGGMASSAGMMPASSNSMKQYVAATNSEREIQVAADVYDARSEPFNIYNQYSFLGSIAQPINASLFSQPTMASKLASLVSFVPSAFGNIGTASAQYNMPAKQFDAKRFSQCDDQQLKDIGVDGDVFCNVRYSMSSQELGFDPDKNTDWMVKNKYVNEETGEPASGDNGDEYKNFLEYCVNRVDPLGSTEIPVADEDDWKSGKNCTEKSEKMSRFRTFTMDLNMQNIIDDTSPQEGGSSKTPAETSSPTLPQGSAQELAKQILANSRITITGRASTQMKNTAAGKPGIPPSQNLDPRLLQVIVALGQKYTFTISSLMREQGYNGNDQSVHPLGEAVDISTMSGISMSSHSSTYQTVVNDAANLLPKGCYIGVWPSIVSKFSATKCKVTDDEGTGPHLHLALRSYTGAPKTW